MKRNAFYLLCGVAALVLLVLFYIFIQIKLPLLILVAAAVAAVLYFVLKKKLTKDYMDERQLLIETKSSSATMKVAATSFILGNLGLAVYAFGIPHMIMPQGPFPQPPQMQPDLVGIIALLELALIIAMFFVYVGVYMYYEHKYGGDIEE